MNSYLIFLIGFVFGIVLLIILFIVTRIAVLKGKPNAKTRFCFDCDFQFNPAIGEKDILYCPYCGKKTYGFDDESFVRFDKDYPDVRED